MRRINRNAVRPPLTLMVTGLLATALCIGPASSLVGESPDLPDTPASNAVVRVEGTGVCTGTLVSPRLVLTAWHCIGSRSPSGVFLAPASDLAFVDGAAFENTPTGVYARTVRGPLGSETDASVPLFVEMAALPGSRVLGMTRTGRLVSMQPVTHARDPWGAAPTRFAGLATLRERQVFGITRTGQLWVHGVSDAGSWRRAGRGPTGVVAMAALRTGLYAATDAGIVLRNDPTASTQWRSIGRLDGIRSLTEFGEILLAETDKGQLFTRTAVPYSEPWQEYGQQEELYRSMQVVGTRWFASSRAGLRSGLASLHWVRRALGTRSTGFASADRDLYETTASGRLLKRSAVGLSGWADIGPAPTNIVELAGDDAGDRLWAATADGQLLARSLPSGSWQAVPDSAQPRGITALAADSRRGVMYAATSGNQLWRRSGLGADAAWTPISYSGQVVGMHAADDRIFALTAGGGVWSRSYLDDAANWDLSLDYDVIPGRWYAYSADDLPGVTIAFGAQGRVRLAATHYQVAGAADVALVRLARDVRASLAVAMTVPVGRAFSLPTTWSGERLQLVGWGKDTNGVLPTIRQRAVANGGHAYPYVSPADGIDPSRMHVVAGSAGGAPMPGDSGGPAIWTDPGGRQLLVGVVNIAGSGTDGVYAATFTRGSVDSHGISHPNTGSWIRHAFATD